MAFHRALLEYGQSVAVGGVLIIGFSFQNELKDLGLRLRSNLIPGYPVQTGKAVAT